MRLNDLLNPNKKLRRAWRRSAAAGMAAVSLFSGTVAFAQNRSLHGEAATLSALPPEAAHMVRIAPGRHIIVLSRQSYGEQPINATTTRDIVMRYFPADMNPPTLRMMEALGRAVSRNSPGALRFTNPEGQVAGCIIVWGGEHVAPEQLAGMLSGIPAEWLRGRVAGTPEQWTAAILLHEASHCAQSEVSERSLADVLEGEIIADQAMTDRFYRDFSYTHREVALAQRDMRAIGAVHSAHASHHTSAGIFTPNEERRWRGADPSGAVVHRDMQQVIGLLHEEVARLLYHRLDWYQLALSEELIMRQGGRSVFLDTEDPNQQYRQRMMEQLVASGAEAFIADMMMREPSLARAIMQRVGEYVAGRTQERDTYAYFSRAAHIIESRGGVPRHSFGARFLAQYQTAVNRYVLAPACATPAPTPQWYCRVA